MATTLAILFIAIILRLIFKSSQLEGIRIIAGFNKIDYAISSNIRIVFISLIFCLRRMLVGKSKLSNKSHSDLSKWGTSMFFHCLLFCALQFLLLFYLFK